MGQKAYPCRRTGCAPTLKIWNWLCLHPLSGIKLRRTMSGLLGLTLNQAHVFTDREGGAAKYRNVWHILRSMR